MRKLLIICFAATVLNGFYAKVKATDFEKYRISIQNLQAVKSEFISLKAAKINGKLSFLTKTNLLFKLIGKPAKLTKPNMNDYCGSFYTKSFKLTTVNGVEAEIYGDTAFVRSINFKKSPNLSLNTPKIILNHHTTLADLKKYFPDAVKASAPLNDVNLGKTIAVSIDLEEKSDDSWLLLFQNNKLVRIDYHIPC